MSSNPGHSQKIGMACCTVLGSEDSHTKGKVLAQNTPRLSSQYKGDLFAPEEQRAGNKKEEGERRGRGVCPGGTKDCLWKERKQTWSIGKLQFIKVEGETPVLE